ncbi:MAG: Stp1/IreP family PP2C-type Ser/Thr phosphatase [Firmicutes bacterium]|nr:Stp1/IreP family PP2C-type Ser/Thr phosphatase [Bacillota bacterium]
MRVGAITHIGQVRTVNQDAYLVKGCVIAVADGMGGHQAGEVASGLALKVIEKWAFDGKQPVASLQKALKSANTLVFQTAKEHEDMAGMGTTLSLAWLLNDRIYIAHIGDSRVYTLSQEKLVQVTWDHSVVGELVRNGALDEEEALRHPHRNILTRSLGTHPTANFDLHELSSASTSALLLCTDGLYSLVSRKEIETLIVNAADPQVAVEELVHLANERGGHDNITALLVFL